MTPPTLPPTQAEPQTSAVPLLRAQEISKQFGGVSAVSEVSFDIEKGEIFSLIGPNGAGKTTVFNLISGIFPLSKGQILLEGEPITNLPSHRLAVKGIGRTFQNLAVFKHASVVENILVGRHVHMRSGLLGAIAFLPKTRKEERTHRERAEEIIEFLEIEHIRDLPVGSLSYGLQKRVELGRALATEPKLLLLDEMVSGMNAEETEDIARFILDMKDELGITILMVEHDMGIVMDISDKICVLNFGRKIAFGSPDEISQNPAVIEAYLGHSQEA